MSDRPPGTLSERVEIFELVLFNALRWLKTHPDENEQGFLSWLARQEWLTLTDTGDFSCVSYVVHELGPSIWRDYKRLL